MNWEKDGFSIDTDKSRLNLPYIHQYLSNSSYWAANVPWDVVERSVKGSLCFGVYHDTLQVGFARVITDFATFGYIADVFIDEAYRGRGLSKWLMEVILAHPELQGFRRLMLATRDAHGLYERFGFTILSFPDRWMQIHYPDRYKTNASN
ncbi:MAG TPA: GNAT family N-acetyltransferase [Chitinophagaceae bacterium]|jgi:GNAT superfamily N-acetyltransferase|nr:GNAT family N-acetyltransferase [Chitinophagaceae bacterium]